MNKKTKTHSENRRSGRSEHAELLLLQKIVSVMHKKEHKCAEESEHCSIKDIEQSIDSLANP